MNSILTYCLAAVTFYALEIAIADAFLGRISPRILTLCYSWGVFMFAIPFLVLSKGEITWPNTKEIFFIFLMIIVSFIAANAHFSALNSFSGAVLLSAFYALLPIFSVFFTLLLKNKYPDSNTIFGCLLAAAAALIGSIAIYVLSKQA